MITRRKGLCTCFTCDNVKTNLFGVIEVKYFVSDPMEGRDKDRNLFRFKKFIFRF